MFKCRPVTSEDKRLVSRFVFELGGFDGLILSGLVERFFDQGGQWKGLLGNHGIASQETHLVDEAGDSLYSITQGRIKRGAEFRIFEFFPEQLLVGRQRDHGVANLVSEAISHGVNEGEIGGFDFQSTQLLALSEVFNHQQRGSGRPRRRPLKWNDNHFENRARRIFRLISEVRYGRASLKDLIHFSANDL